MSAARRRSSGLRKRAARLVLAAIVILLAWSVLKGYADRPAYCGSCTHGSYSTSTPHPLRHLHRLITRGSRR